MTQHTGDMRMGGYTPGLWLATERSGYHEILAPDPGCDWYGHPKMHAVAYCDTEIDEKEQGANARLIAASPDLLEACIAALPRLSMPLDACDQSEAARVYRVVKLAIARATGAPAPANPKEMERG